MKLERLGEHARRKKHKRPLGGQYSLEPQYSRLLERNKSSLREVKKVYHKYIYIPTEGDEQLNQVFSGVEPSSEVIF